jgi:hypothetical protein
MATDKDREETKNFALRLPIDLYDKVKESAEEQHRSINGEIVNRLDKSFQDEKQPANQAERNGK